MFYAGFSDWVSFMDSVELVACASEEIEQQFADIVMCCDRSSIGKRLLGAFYIHVSALSDLDPTMQTYEQSARRYLGLSESLCIGSSRTF